MFLILSSFHVITLIIIRYNDDDIDGDNNAGSRSTNNSEEKLRIGTAEIIREAQPATYGT